MKKPGYLDEVKSLVSEFMQYEIREEELAEMIQRRQKIKPLLAYEAEGCGLSCIMSFQEYLIRALYDWQRK
ncbi:MAG: hypothetical protein ACLUTA_00470 [Blautia wexlerae]